MDEKELLKEIGQAEEQAKQELDSAATQEELEDWRVKYLGRKGRIHYWTSLLPGLAPETRPEIGRKINILKTDLTAWYEEKSQGTGTRELSENLSLPGKRQAAGSLHPLTRVTREMVGIFYNLGFGVVTGPEIETDYYNFEALNTPEGHPARDMWDTFYLDENRNILLRTHTSPVQIRVMQKTRPPFRVIAVGRCFRRDAPDASHSPVFHQMEGLMVDGDGDVRFSHLKGVLTYFVQRFFGPNVKARFAPSYFPFTEPSAEMSISCISCQGQGCPVCGQSGWLEILGCGMVHPQVFRNVGYDWQKVQGFAFGMGIERIAMLKYGISDIRHFLQNDVRFLEQLSEG